MRIKDTEMKNFIGISDVISLLNMCSGVMSILNSINHNFELSAVLMIAALMFDSIDGWVARKTDRCDELGFGKNIDSLSDIVSFGLAPAIFIYTTINTMPILVTLTCLLIVTCGVLRLTRYNAVSDYIESDDFIGFPIPGIAIILSAYYLSGLYTPQVAIILSIIISLAMICNVKYPKFKNKKTLIVSSVLIILMILPLPLTIYNINIPALMILLITLSYFTFHLIHH